MDNRFTLRKFDTKVQHLKYKVLRQVARHAWDGDLLEHVADIPTEIVPGKIPTMRCCVYKERAILAQRVKLAMGGHRDDDRVIHVIDIACDECPAAGYDVTDSCRGCLAHRCEDVCKRGAISFDHNHVAHIDKSKCVECGACAKVCPFAAIVNRKRPCQNACKIKAISINSEGSATVDYSKCISCGACVYQCPFGAITEKSYILNAIDLLKNGDKKTYAVIAPSFASQFTHARSGQVIAGLKKLGFAGVVEAALGADMVALAEARELAEKGFTTAGALDTYSIDKESASPLLRCCMKLQEVTGDPKYITCGEKIGWYLTTWMMHFTVEYPADSVIGQMDFDTFGSTAVSTPHNALDQYALRDVLSFLKLYELTGNIQWRERAQALWYGANQCISDGTFVVNGRMRPAGGQDEAIFHTRWGRAFVPPFMPSQWLPGWPCAFRLENLRWHEDWSFFDEGLPAITGKIN